jgi:vacuolar protein sorting-associated protein 13A/C
MAAKPLVYGIEHVSPFPANADEFLFLDIRMIKGSLTLRRGHYEGHKPLASIAFNGFRPIFRLFSLQGSEGVAGSTWTLKSTLAKLIVTDESLPASRFKKIVQAPRPPADGHALTTDLDDPEPNDFENKELWDTPLLEVNAAQLGPKTGYDKRIEINLEESLIFYHRGFVEEIAQFFKPPDKHETLNALFDAMMEATREYANETLEGLRTAEAPMTRSALEFAITESRNNLIEMHLKAPLVIFPEEYPLPR